MKFFDKVKIKTPGYNKFDLSHEVKLSMNMGDLVPTFVKEVVPGDSFRVNSEIMIRLAPMIAPVMHRVNVWTHYFYVPYRLIWADWEKFITGGPDGTDAPIMPYFNVSTELASPLFSSGSLGDYLGLPEIPAGSIVGDGIRISALWFRAYQFIYNEYYRDQNLSNPVDFSLGSGAINPAGADAAKLLALRKRAWEKDYLTSCLPWAQRGPEVLIPIEGDGDVTYKNVSEIYEQDGGVPAQNATLRTGLSVASDLELNSPGTGKARIENIDDVNFTNTSITINDLRRSNKVQEWLELAARVGSRLTEVLRGFFGVTSSDARLQRPEYLGGGKQPVVISEVVSTYQDPEGTGDPQANMAGHGISVGNTNRFARKFEEHGVVIGITSVLPLTAYQNGISRFFTREERFDMYWPQFANIGEQAVYNHEVYYNPTTTEPKNTFGYQSRYAEYKYAASTVHGDFRNSLDYWHMGRKFDDDQVLNEQFVMSDPTSRIFSVTDPDVHKLYCQIYHRVDALRPMPYYGTPRL